MGCRFFSWTAYFGQNGVVVTVEDQRTAKLSVPSQPQGFRELFFPAKPGTGAVPGRIVDQCLQWHLPRELRRRGSGERSIGKSHARKRIRSGTASPEFRGGVTCRGRGLACLRTRVPACACELAGWRAGWPACLPAEAPEECHMRRITSIVCWFLLFTCAGLGFFLSRHRMISRDCVLLSISVVVVGTNHKLFPI